jgi:hypothetical protein
MYIGKFFLRAQVVVAVAAVAICTLTSNAAFANGRGRSYAYPGPARVVPNGAYSYGRPFHQHGYRGPAVLPALPPALPPPVVEGYGYYSAPRAFVAPRYIPFVPRYNPAATVFCVRAYCNTAPSTFAYAQIPVQAIPLPAQFLTNPFTCTTQNQVVGTDEWGRQVVATQIVLVDLRTGDSFLATQAYGQDVYSTLEYYRRTGVCD